MSDSPLEPTTLTIQEPLLEAGPPQTESLPPGPSSERSFTQKQIYIIVGIVVALVLAMVLMTIYLLTLPSTDTAKIRDVFIIMLALEAFVIGVSVVVMMVQLARLLNLMQNELKPMLESTQSTVNNLRGTTEFLSENMVEPVIKLNESLAAMRSLLSTLRLFRN